MEWKYWYPGGDIVPMLENRIECWREYRFSELAKANGFNLVGIQMHFGREAVDVPSVSNISKARSFWIASVMLEKDGRLEFVCHLAPDRYMNESDAVLISPLKRYDDLVVRYYYVGDVLRPVWSKLIESGLPVRCAGEKVLHFTGIIQNEWISPIGTPIIHERSIFVE